MTDKIMILENSTAEIAILEDTTAGSIRVTEDTGRDPAAIMPGGIDGRAVKITDPQNGDLITFNSGRFVNVPRETITDGGNI